MTGTATRDVLHASCVSIQNSGVLILGPAGSGKSSLAIQLIALGASLVADDRTEVFEKKGAVIATCPKSISGLIEARGIGILRLLPQAHTELVLVVDLGQTETDRLPMRRHVSICGVEIDLVLGQNSAHFPAAVVCYLHGQRHE